MTEALSKRQLFEIRKAADATIRRATAGIPRGERVEKFETAMTSLLDPARGQTEQYAIDALQVQLGRMNVVSKVFRQNTRRLMFKDRPTIGAIMKGVEAEGGGVLEGTGSRGGVVSKAVLDVGTLTNFQSITGGQTVGYVSLDTDMARGTIRPNSFTIYQALRKSMAKQVVDYWAYNDDDGGPPSGAAFASFGSVSSGTLSTDVGDYNLENITLKLALDGRAMTIALAAQNSFVDLGAEENFNAALAVLRSVNWAIYWGNPNFFPNQFQGIFGLIPSGNVFDFQEYATAYSSQGWSTAQALFNMMYQVAGDITESNTYGQTTHVMMDPIVEGTLQQTITTLLNNVVNLEAVGLRAQPSRAINGDLLGMNTRYGEMQFAMDLLIPDRDTPVQARVNVNGISRATTSTPTPPVGVTATVSGATVANSAWTNAYASGGAYMYAVASCDQSMNESVLTAGGLVSGGVVSAVSGIVANGAVFLTVAPPAANDAYAFRVFRSYYGYTTTGTPTSTTAANFRYIGTVLASGSANVVFADLNQHIPGSATLFGLDLADEDNALDFRYMLPLTKISLFAQNLYMPWAVAAIGSVRLRIPKFHWTIKNFVPQNPKWNPLGPPLQAYSQAYA